MRKTANIEVVDNSKTFNPISDTLGYLSRTINTLQLPFIGGNKRWSTANADGTKELLLKAIEDYDKTYPNLNTKVYLGGGPTIKDRISDARKLLGPARDFRDHKFKKIMSWGLAAPSIYNDINAAANAADHYSPGLDTITIFNPTDPTLRHELGHAADITARGRNRVMAESYVGGLLENLLGINPVMLKDEYAASRNALISAGPEASKKQLQRIGRELGAAFGTYGAYTARGLANKYIPKDSRYRKYYDKLTHLPINIPGADKLNNALDAKIDSAIMDINRRAALKEVTKRLTHPIVDVTTPLGALAGGAIGHFLGGSKWARNLANGRGVHLPFLKFGSLKHGQMEANAAMIKEIAGQGDMERVAPGIDPEVVSAIASILAMDGNGDSQEDMEALLKDNPEIIEEML